MQELIKDIQELQTDIESAYAQLNIAGLTVTGSELQTQMNQPDFWQDSAAAQKIAQQHAKLQQKAGPWQTLKDQVTELSELAQLNDESLQTDLTKQYQQLLEQLNTMKNQLKLAGPYDDHGAIMSIHAGAGGADAQDWAAMLQRMYMRWAEQQSVKVDILTYSGDDGAGIKSCTLALSGADVYGRLKGEHGVHRLVRQSPFNSDNLRQTSFALVEVVPKIDTPDEIAIDDKDLKIDVYRSGGKGGQSVNTTDSAVRVTHLPTNIVVAIQNERSQLQNRETAMTILRSKLAQLSEAQHAEKLDSLKGPNQAAAWGNQIRSYVLHPYKQVKDLRTQYTSSDPETVLEGDIDAFIDAYLDYNMGKNS